MDILKFIKLLVIGFGLMGAIDLSIYAMTTPAVQPFASVFSGICMGIVAFAVVV